MSVAIFDLIPDIDGNRIVNVLLDGTMHIQTVGDPLKTVRFDCVSTTNNIDAINQIYFEGEPVRVEFDKKYYTGRIMQKSEWEVELFGEYDERLYRSEITILVELEGAI